MSTIMDLNYMDLMVEFVNSPESPDKLPYVRQL